MSANTALAAAYASPTASVYPCSDAAWIATTPALAAADRDALWRLLSNLWRHGAPLPGRVAQLAAIAGVNLRRWDEIALRLAPFFTLDRDRRWICPELLARRPALLERRRARQPSSTVLGTPA